MANLYLDHDMAAEAAALLKNQGHVVATARELGLDAAPDYMQLLTAFRRESIMVTHNRKDFLELHGAWLTWSQEWSVAMQHPGIIVVPREEAGVHWTAATIAARVQALLAEGAPRANELYRWRDGAWVRQP